jgi:hypothetical protein
VKKLDFIAVLTSLFILAGASPAFAQADEHESASDHEAAHDFHPNLLALFVGVTGEGRNEKGLTLGIEYERRLNMSFGIGVLAEHSYGDLDFWVYAVPFAYHIGRWKFYIAPGVEDGDHGGESLVRLGGEYAYKVGAWEISPQIDVDFVDGDEILVLGVTFGKGF